VNQRSIRRVGTPGWRSGGTAPGLALMAALAGIASRHAAQHAEEASWG
jgi:hypothetical protein